MMTRLYDGKHYERWENGFGIALTIKLINNYYVYRPSGIMVQVDEV